MIHYILSGKKPPIYGVMAICGFIAALLYIIIISRLKKEKADGPVYVFVWACLGALAGAKVLYIIVNIRTIAAAFADGVMPWYRYLAVLLRGGFVFYGGLIAGIASAVAAMRYFKMDVDKTVFILTPAAPLLHAFGRVGCHLTGCCYGRQTDGTIGVVYDDPLYAPAGVRLFPVQLTETVCLALIFIYLLLLVLKNTPGDIPGSSMILRYLGIYALIRFVLEFFRGDVERGFIGPLSLSQWLSLCIIIFVMIYYKVVNKNISKERDKNGSI